MVHLFKLIRLMMFALAMSVMCMAQLSYSQSNDVKLLQKELNALKKEVAALERKKSSTGVGNRLNELEVTVEEAQEKIGSRAIAHAFEGTKFDIGGFLHTAYTYVDAKNESVGSFNRQNFELLIGAELTESWSAFIAGGFLRESNDPFSTGSRTDPQFDSNNRNPLIIGWANYQASDEFNIRMGRMITPHGIINIEHFPATLYDPEQPQFLRPFGGNTLFPNFSTGLQVHGEHYGDSVNMKYAIYAVNAPNPGGNLQANNEEIFGGRFALSFFDSVLTLGLNFSDSYRASTNSDNTMQGLDLHINASAFQLKSEYYTTDEDVSGDRETFYVQPIVQLSDLWSLFYRYDFLDSGDVGGETLENVVGINYTPNYNIRLRITWTQKEFTDSFDSDLVAIPDADILQLSGTFSF